MLTKTINQIQPKKYDFSEWNTLPKTNNGFKLRSTVKILVQQKFCDPLLLPVLCSRWSYFSLESRAHVDPNSGARSASFFFSVFFFCQLVSMCDCSVGICSPFIYAEVFCIHEGYLLLVVSHTRFGASVGSFRSDLMQMLFSFLLKHFRRVRRRICISNGIYFHLSMPSAK